MNCKRIRIYKVRIYPDREWPRLLGLLTFLGDVKDWVAKFHRNSNTKPRNPPNSGPFGTSPPPNSISKTREKRTKMKINCRLRLLRSWILVGTKFLFIYPSAALWLGRNMWKPFRYFIELGKNSCERWKFLDIWESWILFVWLLQFSKQMSSA